MKDSNIFSSKVGFFFLSYAENKIKYLLLCLLLVNNNECENNI